MIHYKNEWKPDILTKDIEKNVQNLEDFGGDDSKSPHIFTTFMLAMTGFILFTSGLYNLGSIYRYHDVYERDSLEWTTSASVLIFGLMAILVAYCSYCALCIRDLGVAVMVVTMQNSMIIIQLTIGFYVNKNRLTWHSVLGRLIEDNRALCFFVGIIFIIHAFSWIFSYRFCNHLILEKEQQPDRNAQEIQGAKRNQFLNLAVLIICLAVFLSIEIGDMIVHNSINSKGKLEY